MLTTTCLIHSDLCEIIIPILVDNLHTKQVFILKHNNYKYIGYSAYPTSQKKIMFNKVVNPAIYFFDAIQQVVDNDLYLVLSINGWFLKWKEANPDKTYTSDILIDSAGHAATIVNYDYSDEENKSFTVINSWGGETPYITILEQELLALSKNTWIITSICYVEYDTPKEPSAKIVKSVGGKTKKKRKRKRRLSK